MHNEKLEYWKNQNRLQIQRAPTGIIIPPPLTSETLPNVINVFPFKL
jgi:hypothetical protein